MKVNIRGCGLDSVGAVTVKCEHDDDTSGSVKRLATTRYSVGDSASCSWFGLDFLTLQCHWGDREDSKGSSVGTVNGYTLEDRLWFTVESGSQFWCSHSSHGFVPCRRVLWTLYMRGIERPEHEASPLLPSSVEV